MKKSRKSGDMEHFKKKIKSIFLLSKFGLEKNRGAVEVSWRGGAVEDRRKFDF